MKTHRARLQQTVSDVTYLLQECHLEGWALEGSRGPLVCQLG